MSMYVYEYAQKKMLAKLGYKFDGGELSQTKADAFALIANRMGELEQRELKKNRKKK